jgi:serine/threonine-protein kinase HipA
MCRPGPHGIGYSAGYQDLAQIIRQISSNPVRDLQQLFRQLVFNVLIGNTDDHLKNFCMLHDGSGWHLSPAFDLVPNIGVNREHVLRVGLYHVTPDRKTLLQEAKAFGVKRQQKAAKIIDEIFEVVSDWQNYFERVQVPAADISIIGKDIESRLRCVS